MSRRDSIHETEIPDSEALRVSLIHTAAAGDVTSEPETEPTPPPTSRGDSVVLSREMFESLISRATTQAAPPPRRLERTIKWGDLPKWTSGDELDSWLIAAETVLKANNVRETDWALHLMACPAIPSQVRTRIGQAPTYHEYRRKLLEAYGPSDAIGTARNRINDFRGADRDEVLMGLEAALDVYNRASRDEGREEWTRRDLIQPFIRAFPTATQKVLSAALRPAMRDPDPLRYLYDVVASAPASGSLVVASVTPDDHEPAVIASVQPQPPKRRRTQPPFQRRPCSGCGGDCRDRRSCPAVNENCKNCNRRGHYARVCRSAAAPTESKPHFQ